MFLMLWFVAVIFPVRLVGLSEPTRPTTEAIVLETRRYGNPKR